MKDKKLFLRSVHVDEALVQDYMDQAVDVFKLNTVGPQKYAQYWSSSTPDVLHNNNVYLNIVLWNNLNSSVKFCSLKPRKYLFTEYNNDMRKSHFHLLLTHLINIGDYKTSFVRRPCQLVAICW